MIKKTLQSILDQTTLSTQESWWLLEHITQKSQAQLLIINHLTAQELQNLHSALTQIKDEHKPLAYILGFVPFLDLKIQVQPPILIPRHETEEWVSKVIEQFREKQMDPPSSPMAMPDTSAVRTILDIGTGSGCIALALAKNFPHAHITAIDINPQALDLARHNARLNNIKNITFLQSDLFANVTPDSKFDLIVSNPPYINPACFPTLTKQVTDWEDHQALFAQDQGLTIITQILQQSSQFLQKNSALPAQLIIEIDHDQHKVVLELAQQHGWHARAVQDAFGQWRTVWLNFKRNLKKVPTFRSALSSF